MIRKFCKTRFENSQRKWRPPSSRQKEMYKDEQHNKENLTQVRADIKELRSTPTTKDQITATNCKSVNEFGQFPKRPIDHSECRVLTEGAADKFFHKTYKTYIKSCKQWFKKKELQHQLQRGVLQGQSGQPPSYLHPRTQVYHKFFEHTQSLTSVMQYYQAYKAIDLVTNDLPLLKGRITLKHAQFKDLWDQANHRARDTLGRFIQMWCH